MLDALADWRQHLKERAEPDHRYGESFQGWFEGAIPKYPFEIKIGTATRPERRMTAWLMSPAGGIGPLVKDQQDAAPGTIEANSEYVGVVRSWQGSAPIVSMLGGNEYALRMLNAWPAYDFVDESDPSVQPDVPIIDETFIDSHMESWLDAASSPLTVLRQLVSNPLAHVLPPPPREHPHKASHLEALEELISRHGFAADRMRVKWYRRYCRRLSARLAAIQCDVITPPRAVSTSDGLLREDLADGLTHGNEAYGSIIAGEIESWLEGVRQ